MTTLTPRQARRARQKQARRARRADLPVEAIDRADYVFGDPAVTDAFAADRKQTLEAASDHYDAIVDGLRRRGAPAEFVAETEQLAVLARLWDANIGRLDRALGEKIGWGLYQAQKWRPGMGVEDFPG